MESTTLRLLKKLAVEREISVVECAALLPKKTHDHLDFYPLASLIKEGLADMYVISNGQPFREQNEMQMAICLYAWAIADGKEFEYRGMRFGAASFGRELVFATAKGHFALDEMWSKRAERIWAFAAGILTAVAAAALQWFVG